MLAIYIYKHAIDIVTNILGSISGNPKLDCVLEEKIQILSSIFSQNVIV